MARRGRFNASSTGLGFRTRTVRSQPSSATTCQLASLAHLQWLGLSGSFTFTQAFTDIIGRSFGLSSRMNVVITCWGIWRRISSPTGRRRCRRIVGQHVHWRRRESFRRSQHLSNTSIPTPTRCSPQTHQAPPIGYLQSRDAPGFSGSSERALAKNDRALLVHSFRSALALLCAHPMAGLLAGFALRAPVRFAVAPVKWGAIRTHVDHEAERLLRA